MVKSCCTGNVSVEPRRMLQKDLSVTAQSSLVGCQIRDLREMDLNVKVLLVKEGDHLNLSPAGDTLLTEGAVLVVAGYPSQLEKMQAMAGTVSEAKPFGKCPER